MAGNSALEVQHFLDDSTLFSAGVEDSGALTREDSAPPEDRARLLLLELAVEPAADCPDRLLAQDSLELGHDVEPYSPGPGTLQLHRFSPAPH
jgi:hypothetical protein